jgi:hypothetical protein
MTLKHTCGPARLFKKMTIGGAIKMKTTDEARSLLNSTL